MKKIGELLLENKIINSEQLERAISIQKSDGEQHKIGEILIDLGYIDIEVLLKYLDMQIKTKFNEEILK
jgi:hypothetical protein